MSFINEPLYVAAVLCLLIAFSEWLSRQKHFCYLGSALIVILATAVLANLGLLPSSRNAPPLYDGIFNYIAPLAIFFLLLDVKLKDLRQAGPPMLILFSLGELATMAGAKRPMLTASACFATTPTNAFKGPTIRTKRIRSSRGEKAGRKLDRGQRGSYTMNRRSRPTMECQTTTNSKTFP